MTCAGSHTLFSSLDHDVCCVHVTPQGPALPPVCAPGAGGPAAGRARPWGAAPGRSDHTGCTAGGAQRSVEVRVIKRNDGEGCSQHDGEGEGFSAERQWESE